MLGSVLRLRIGIVFGLVKNPSLRSQHGLELIDRNVFRLGLTFKPKMAAGALAS